MLPGASAPPAPAGYSNVVIVPGLTAVLPDGYALPAYVAAAATGAGLARKARDLGHITYNLYVKSKNFLPHSACITFVWESTYVKHQQCPHILAYVCSFVKM